MRNPLRFAILALAVLLLSSGTVDAWAQSYPTKPIRLLVGASPGGGTDILARLVGQKLSERLGQQVLVDNRPGANMIIATEIVAKAAPDGYTLVMAATPHVTNPSLHAGNLPFDALKDFAWITQLTTASLVLMVNPSVKANSVRELITLAKSKPGQLNFGSAGTGGSPHLAGVLFERMANVEMLHVPYKGLGPAFTDLLGGQLSLIFGDITMVAPHIKSGKLRAVAVTTARRAAALPDVPTIAESGVPGYQVPVWYGIITTAGTPKEVVSKLNRDIRDILQSPEVKEQLSILGAEPVGSTPEEFETFFKGEAAKWAKIIKEANIRAN